MGIDLPTHQGLAGDRRRSPACLRRDRPYARRRLAVVLSSATTYNGIFPCFFGGFVSRLFLNISSALISRGRVSLGSMMSST